MSLGIIRKDFPRLEKGQRLFGILSVDHSSNLKLGSVLCAAEWKAQREISKLSTILATEADVA